MNRVNVLLHIDELTMFGKENLSKMMDNHQIYQCSVFLRARDHDKKFKILGQNSWQKCNCLDISNNFWTSHFYNHFT